MVDARALVAEWWPPAAVVVRTPRLELRWPSMDDLIALAAVAADGVHAEDRMPFYTPWTRGSAVERARNVLRWNWKGWGEWDPAKWSFGAVAVVDGVVVGTQGMQATDYAVCRTIETGCGWAWPTRARASARRCAPRCSTWPSPASTPKPR